MGVEPDAEANDVRRDRRPRGTMDEGPDGAFDKSWEDILVNAYAQGGEVECVVGEDFRPNKERSRL